MVINSLNSSKLISFIKKGEIGVLPTDTIYGLVGFALNKKSINRIYKVKGRKSSKPFIILISSLDGLKIFGIKIDTETKKILQKVWPGKVSVILPCVSKNFLYLHRGIKNLAFRLPSNKKLKRLISKTGPLVAPSANPEGLAPAQTIKQAKKYFKDKLDFYVDGGKLSSKPSTLIKISENKAVVLRQGSSKIRI